MARLYLVGLVTLIALGVLVWLLKRRKRTEKNGAQPFSGNVDTHDSIDTATSAQHTRFATDSWETEARTLARNGRKIEAIKLVREHTGLDLKSAKDYVERWN